MNKLTIFSDTHFILATGQNLLSKGQLTIIETEIKEWIKSGGLLCLPFDCEIEDLRDTSKLFAVDITGGNRIRYPYELGAKD